MLQASKCTKITKQILFPKNQWKIIVLLIALVFLAACERPYDGEKIIIEGRLVDQNATYC
jgi:uncharacterized lipoprotein YajG